MERLGPQIGYLETNDPLGKYLDGSFALNDKPEITPYFIGLTNKDFFCLFKKFIKK